MDDNKDSILILLGLTFGAILTFILLGKPQTPQTVSTQQNWQPIDIPRVDDIRQVSQPPVDLQFVQMTYQLGKATSQLEQVAYKLQETVSQIQHQ